MGKGNCVLAPNPVTGRREKQASCNDGQKINLMSRGEDANVFIDALTFAGRIKYMNVLESLLREVYVCYL